MAGHAAHLPDSTTLPGEEQCKEGEAGDRRKESSKYPFDWLFNVNHLTSSRLRGSTPLSEIGFDGTVIAPNIPPDLS